MADAKPLGRCIVCNEPGSQHCKQCKDACYCSQNCQRNDWPTHKLICEVYAKFDFASRPDGHILALSLSIDSEKPQMVWLDCDWRMPGGYQAVTVDHLLGPEPASRFELVTHNIILKRELSGTIYIYHRDTYGIDGSKPNESVAAIQATRHGKYYYWCGPLIAVAHRDSGINPVYCKDFNMADFRHLADHFRSYRFKPCNHSGIKSSPFASDDLMIKTKIKGVRINCAADRNLMGRPPFEEVNLLATDRIFFEHDTSEIAARIGIPIFTRKLLPDPKWRNGPQADHENRNALFLHINCDPNAKFGGECLGWGWASAAWLKSIGSVIVVRQDKKPLSLWHMEALCKYCCEDIQPLFTHSTGGINEDKPMSKKLVLDMICKQTFEVRCYKVIHEKLEKWSMSEDVANPYEV